MPELSRIHFAPDLVEGDTPNCPYSHDPIRVGEEVVKCPVCGSWYHVGCWQENDNACANLGCPGEGAVSELSPPPPPLPPAPPPPASALEDEIELTPADPFESGNAERVNELAGLIELLPDDEAEDVIDIDIPAAPPPVPARPRPPEVNCPYCHNPIDPARPALACRVCHTPYHPECWAAAGRCSITGCQSRQSETYRPTGSPPVALDVDVTPTKGKETFWSRLKKWWAGLWTRRP